MNRTDRLNAILIQLQSKRVVRAHEIADRFDISLRTVYRDIRALEEAGVPVGAEAGVGYYLLDNYHLPPVMFTNDEASALLFGEKLVEQMSDEKTKQDFCSALYKIKAILKPGEKDYLEKLHSKVKVFNFNSMGENFRQLYLNEIQLAIVNKSVLEIQYEARYSEEAVCRLIEPIGLMNYSSRWHMVAFCRLRNDYRDFRLDRIISLIPTNENFKGKMHPSIEEYMKMANPMGNEANISVLIPRGRKKLVEESKYWYGFIAEEDLGETIRMQFSNEDLNGFATWLLNSGSHAKVEQPIELDRLLQKFIDDVIRFYRKQ